MRHTLGSIHAGTQAVLGFLADQDERSGKVDTSSVSVKESSVQIQQIMDDVSRISTEVTANIAEIAVGVQTVGTAVERVFKVSVASGEGSSTLDREVHRFSLAPQAGESSDQG